MTRGHSARRAFILPGVFGLGIVAAEPLRSWGAEAAEKFIAKGLVLAIVSLSGMLVIAFLGLPVNLIERAPCSGRRDAGARASCAMSDATDDA